MNYPFFIARRLYGSSDSKDKASKPAVTIAIAGIAIGLAVLIISFAVVLGFKHSIRDKAVGFVSDIQVTNFIQQADGSPMPIAVGDSLIDAIKDISGVTHVERFAYKQGILKTDSDFIGVMFKGVGNDFDSTFIHNNMYAGAIPHFGDSTALNEIVLSRSMADKLNVSCGERLFAYFIDNNGVRVRRFTVKGIYQTNLSSYDEAICLANLSAMVKLNGWQPDQVSGLGVTIGDFNKLDQTADIFATRINRKTDKYGATYTSATVKDLNPQIFSWLSLLDMNVWIILILMLAVAGVSMCSGLLILILERTQMIGLMKALGARNTAIRRTFLWLSAFIITRGLVIGNALGLGLCLLQKWTGLFKLDAATYYVSKVPIELNALYVILLNLATFLLCVIILVGPSFLVSRIRPAKTMQYE